MILFVCKWIRISLRPRLSLSRLLLGLAVLAALSFGMSNIALGDDTVLVNPPAPKTSKYDQEGLTTLVLTAMKTVEARLSPVRRVLVAKLLARVAMETFENDDERIYWIAVVGRESHYEGRAVSKAGAVGLGQLMPKYAKDFGALCGMEAVEPEDLRDDQVNAHLSACYFKALVRRHDGVIPLALAGYNAGPNSKDVKNFRNLGSLNHESANYVSGVWLIANTLTNGVMETN